MAKLSERQPTKFVGVPQRVNALKKHLTEDTRIMAHPGDAQSHYVDTTGAKAYSIFSPTMTLVRTTDGSGAALLYATMVWQFESFNRWTTKYKNNKGPDIVVRFMSFDGQGHIGYPYDWDLGQVDLPCTPCQDFFAKITVTPQIYDVTLNWEFSFGPTTLYQAC
jgi:hypothetical protein